MSVLFRREPASPSARPPGETRQAGHGRATSVERAAIQTIIEQRLVTTEFQPIVRLDTGDIVGFESFARGPATSALATPREMFRAAAAAGVIGELDLIAANAAFAAARFSPHMTDLTFFINVEPAGMRQQLSEELIASAAEAIGKLRVVFEFPERSLVHDPVYTIGAAQMLRRAGGHIALDNVGDTPEVNALIPLLQPEVLKLSPALLSASARQAADVVQAVASYADRTGALVVGQGIETDAHRLAAIGMGATYGQGYLLGRLTTVPEAGDGVVQPLRIAPIEPFEEICACTAGVTPYALLAPGRTPMRVDLSMLDALAQRLVERAEAMAEPFVMIVVGTHPEFLGGGRLPKLRALGTKASLLLILATDREVEPGRDAQVVALEATDPLREELGLLVWSPYGASMVAARPTPEGQFECLVGSESAPVLESIRNILCRFLTDPRPGSVTKER